MKMYVKKIWSLHPTQYKYISYEKAIKEYNEYLIHCIRDKHDYIKTIDEWLKTEI